MNKYAKLFIIGITATEIILWRIMWLKIGRESGLIQAEWSDKVVFETWMIRVN